MSPSSQYLSVLLFALLTTGCASEPKRPTEQLTRAQTLIEQAEKSGAQQYAAADLETARNKLQAANQAAEKGKQEAATQLATEAAVDAELATARAASGEARKAAEELGKSTDTLREETTRKPESEGTPQP
jgi:PBP1b-binding outer membrane lipoprotein LpoB